MTERDGGAIVAETLVRHGVRSLFTLCGGHISPILVGAKRLGIRIVGMRDEASAAFAADAVARLTGGVGVAAVTAGPGVTNTITAVKNAQMAQSPLVVLGGASATLLRGRGSLQDIDQLSLMRSCTKWATGIKSVPAIAPTLDRAIALAQKGVPGPVFVEIPLDVLYPESLVRKWYRQESGVDSVGGVAGVALDLFLRQHLFRRFRMPALVSPRPFSWPRNVGRLGPARLRLRLPDRDVISRAIAILERAERPVLIVGGQALSGEKEPGRLARAVERLALPTFLGGMARGLLGRESAIQLRHERSAALREADAVVVAGFPFDFRLGYGRSIASCATVIAANLDSVALRKNRRPEVAAEQHPGRFLEALADCAETLTPRAGWLAKLRAREAERDAEIARQAAAANSPGVDPRALFLRIEERMAKDALIIVDGGDFAATAAYVLRPRGPLHWLDPGVFGTLGVGGGYAIGAATVHPEREIWLIYGDGSSAYSLAELDTCARSGFAPIAVVGTDGSWAQIERDQVEILGDAVGTELARCDYHAVAEGYGAAGLLLDDSADIDKILIRAQKLAQSGRPVLVNVQLGASDFRKGSLSI